MDWSQIQRDGLDLARKLVDEGWDRLRAVRLVHLLSHCVVAAEALAWLDVKRAAETVLSRLQPLISGAEKPVENTLRELLAPLVILELHQSRSAVVVERPLLPKGWVLGLLDGAPSQAGLLAELEWAGLKVEHLARDAESLSEWLRGEALSCVVLVNMDSLESAAAMAEFRRARASQADRDDVVFVAVTDGHSFANQLAALRAGMDLFLEKPVTKARLQDVLENIVWKPERPYRVMLVDDEKSTLDYVANLLEAEDIQVVGLTDPLVALDFVAEFDPDVLLVDIEMPVCNGTELVTLLRQKDRYAHIPVIYLTAWDDRDHRMAARIAGGEDFLTKPVDPRLLAASVVSRARRHRHQNHLSLMRVDLVDQLERFRFAVDQHAIVSMTDAQGRIIFANQQFCDISGYSLNELLGQNHRIVKSGEHSEGFYREMWEIIASGRVWRGEIKNRRGDGSFYWVKATIVPFLNAQGVPYQYYSIRTDITEQRFQRELMEARAAIAAQASDDLTALLGGIVRHAERLLPGAACAIHLLDESKEFLCQSAAPSLPTELHRAFVKFSLATDAGCCVDAINRGEVVVVDDMRQHPCMVNNRDIAQTLQMRACWSQPIRSPEGAMLGTFTTFYRDIHVPGKLEHVAVGEFADVCGSLLDRVRKREQLRKREATTSSILRTTKEGFMRFDIDGRIIELNPAMAAILGREEKDVLGHEPGEYLDAMGAPACGKMLASVFAGHSARDDMDLFGLDGKRVACSVNAAPLTLENGQADGGFALVSDISARKRLEDTLLNQAQVLSLVRQGMEHFVGTRDIKATADFLLSGLLSVTGSAFGLIGEILHDENGAPYIKSHGMTDISWNEETRGIYERAKSDGMEFRNPESLFGAVMTTGEMVISDDPQHDPRGGGLPSGHPPLKRFLGMPVYYGEDMVGIYGMANRAEPYDLELLALLAPFNASYAAIIAASRAQARQETILSDLKAEKERAESASHAKSEFLAGMSHELRTPLNAILGFSQLINFDTGLPEETRDLAREIESAGQHLLALIGDLLDLARIEAGRVEMGLEAVPVATLMSDCYSLAIQLAKERAIVVDFKHASCEEIVVVADRMRLKQVMLNLISNGIKYNREGGNLSVGCQVDPSRKQLLLTVQDTGKGISPENLARLFAPFERLGADRGPIQGTGIGLVISRHLARMMGGDIGVSSEVGVGSCFWIELPLSLTAEINTLNREEASVEHDADDKGLVRRMGTVLYIEDNPVNLKLMEMALSRRKDIRLISAVSAEEGLEVAEREMPDLVLLDINLPGMDGYEGLQAMKARSTLSRIPVVAVTANAMKGDRERGLTAGFVDYVTKPFKVDELFVLLDRWLPATTSARLD